jgi:hypothetical protein
MKYIIAILFVLGMVACGQGPQGPQGAMGPQGPAGSSTSTETSVQQLVDEQNAERAALGQAPLTQGLTCTFYTVSQSTTCLVQNNTSACTAWSSNAYTTVGSFRYTGVFNQPTAQTSNGLNVLPTALQGISQYQSWYVLRCSGQLVITDNNYHEFDLTSDDGSNLYIDGLLIANDGLHGTQTKSAAKFLGYGLHSFELDYLQASGQETLILNEDGAVMQASGFYH